MHKCERGLHDCGDHPRWHVIRNNTRWAVFAPHLQRVYTAGTFEEAIGGAQRAARGERHDLHRV